MPPACRPRSPRHTAEQQPGFAAIEAMLRRTASSEAAALSSNLAKGTDKDKIEEVVLERLRQCFWQNWEAFVNLQGHANARHAASRTPAAAFPLLSRPPQSGAGNGWEAMVLLDIPDCYFPTTPEECFAYPQNSRVTYDG